MSENITEPDRSAENRIGDPIPAKGIGSRIAATAVKLGSRKNAANISRISSDSLRRWIAEEVSPSFDGMARLAAAAGVSLDWLATGKEPQMAGASEPVERQLGSVDRQRLFDVVETIEEELAARRIDLAPSKKAKLIVLVYEEIAESEGAGVEYSKDKVIRLIDLAS